MPTISAYTTTRNASSMDFPFEESIRSMLAFTDEVVVLDTSDGSDDTLKLLEALQAEDARVKVFHEPSIDWTVPNHGILDGQTKALARSKCTGDFLWQFDCDEIVHELDAPKIRPFLHQSNYLRQCPIVAFPVTEFWGSKGKVRVDVNPWKARLSRNLPDITHGIPIQLRRQFNGLDYASPGTDTCDYISRSTGQVLPVMGFMDNKAFELRQMCLRNDRLVKGYETWFNGYIDQFPGVFHYSWFSIERKIKQYRSFWTTFWKAMYGPDSSQNKDPNWNPFFEVPWSEVTDQMINEKAKDLEEKTGGHIFHSRWSGSVTPSIKVNRSHPKVIEDWVKSHG